MRIVIVGPGALGSLLTARTTLSLPGKGRPGTGNDDSLCLLDYRPARAGFLQQHGLLLEDREGQVRCFPDVTADPAICAAADVIFLCVKSTVLAAALDRIRPFVTPGTLVLAMQNGIGHFKTLSILSGHHGVGITSEGANLAKPGHVRHGGFGITRLGLPGSADPAAVDLLDRVAALLNRAGFETRVTTEPLKYVWAKLFVNVGINALTAIHNCRNGELLGSESTRQIMVQAVREAELVARAGNIMVAEDPVAVTLRVCETTGNNISSMLQDVRNRRRTEIGAINGAIVEKGNSLGIPTPVNRELVDRVRAIEAGYGEGNGGHYDQG